MNSIGTFLSQQNKINYLNNHREPPTQQHHPMKDNPANQHYLRSSPKNNWNVQDEQKHSSAGQNRETATIIKNSNHEYEKDANRRNVLYRHDKQGVKTSRAREHAGDEKMTEYRFDRSPNWPFNCEKDDQAALR